ncbi:glycosyltransferase family 4 protein [Thalassobaculum sp.]|uniref:glycosyltransferase family 4 protein n=1 Tax=Thalassobaculum sp. TaxID=2022740 RepID=UPI0032EB8A9D
MLAGRRLLWIVAEDWFFRLHYLPLATALVDAGAEVHLAARCGRRGPAAAAAIRDAGIQVHPLIRLDRTGLDPLADLRAISELTALCRTLSPDLVQCVALKPVLYGTLAAERAGIPVRLAWLPGLGHVFTGTSLKARLLRPGVSLLLRRVLGPAAVTPMVLNADDRSAVARLSGRPAGSVVVMPGTGVDLDRFVATPEPDGPTVVAFVGRMLEEKGLADLLAAARLLRDRGSPVRVRLVGAPDPESPTAIPETRLRAWAAEGAIDWSGQTDDVAAVWRQAHIAVLPSYREGLGMSVLEAAACGRPAVATDVPGCREAVDPGVTGLLVPPHDPPALASAIADLARNTEGRRAMGTAARSRVEQRFSLTAVRESLIELYEQRLVEPRAARHQSGHKRLW